MSLDDLRSLVADVGFGPRTVDIGLPQRSLLGRLSDEAQEFIDAIKRRFKCEQIEEINGVRWTSDYELRKRFECLAEETRLHVCLFVTVLVHELSHYCDFLTTPFGANFYTRTLQEYLAFQSVAPYMLKNPDLIPEGRLVDYETGSMVGFPSKIQNTWNELLTQVKFFEALGDGGNVSPRFDKIVGGWTGEEGPLYIFGNEVRPVRIREFFDTIDIPNAPGWYLRPLTILEARAVAHSLMWLAILFVDIENAKYDVLRYFKAFYPRRRQAADYLFLLDFAAQLVGRHTFDDVIEDLDQNLMHYMSRLISNLGWYALHAPGPKTEVNHLLYLNPIFRLMHIIMCIEDAIETKEFVQLKNPTDFLTSVDTYESSKQFGAPDLDSLFKDIRVEALRCMDVADKKVENPEMKEHFMNIFYLLYTQFQNRKGLGYAYTVGVPLTGNPFYRANISDKDPLVRYPFSLSTAPKRWFTFRKNFLYKFMGRDKVVSGLKACFGASASDR